MQRNQMLKDFFSGSFWSKMIKGNLLSSKLGVKLYKMNTFDRVVLEYEMGRYSK